MTLLMCGAAVAGIVTALPVVADGCAWLGRKLRPRRRYHGRHVKPGRGRKG